MLRAPDLPCSGDVTPPAYRARVVPTAPPSRTSRSARSSFGADLADLDLASGTIRRIVRSVEPGALFGDQARQMVDLLAALEQVVASGIARLAPRVLATGAYAKEGHGSAQDWLGAVSGTSARSAKSRLASAERAALDPLLSEALLDGALSAPQIKLLAEAAAVSPEAPGTLLDLVAAGSSHQELCDAATRLRAAAQSAGSERASRARVHALRHCRWHQDPDGGIRGSFFCDEAQWARVMPLLEAEAKRRFRAAGAGSADSFEAHRMDALIDLLARTAGSGSAGQSKGARPHTLVLIDAEALRRGTTHGDELCEIEGIGPVSVASASELLGQGGLQYLIREGFDIKTVTKSTRNVTQCIEVALIARDRTCVVAGCGKRKGLQRDHCFVDFEDQGPTELDNLARLCPEHHDLKTHGGYRLEGGPGHWKWIAPLHPKSAGAIARAKKVAVAKANRNKPRRT